MELKAYPNRCWSITGPAVDSIAAALINRRTIPSTKPGLLVNATQKRRDHSAARKARKKRLVPLFDEFLCVSNIQYSMRSVFDRLG